MATAGAASPDDRLGFARILVAIGEPYDAEVQLARVLEERPDDLGALDLLAKIKHMRGELTAAIALWAQVHEHSPRNQTGLLRLSSMLQLARDAERGGGEFLVLGHFQLWRKPAAHLELEDVFRTFLARRPDEAQERCDELARKYQGKDADLYKLAVLAKAWIAELTGEMDRARSILEDLGQERGFETDSDRVLALARLYEQLGAPELLEKAVHIYEFFERSFEKVSVLGHLASLQRRLGRQEDAARYEERFVDLFRRRMHEPTRRDAVRSAARWYVPLRSLEGLPFTDAATLAREAKAASEAGFTSAERAVGLGGATLAPPSSMRERAVQMALTGDRSGARASLARGAEVLDLKYQADLAALDGSEEEAVRLYLECLRQDPDDIRIVESLLGRYARTADEAVAAHFREPEAARRTAARLDAAIRAAPARASLWRQMEALRRIEGRLDDAERCARRATAREEAAARGKSAVGRVLAAAVYHFVGKARGLIHEVWATRRPAEPGRGGFLDEILGNLTPEMVQGVRNTFLSVREYARARWPLQTRDVLDYSYTYKVTKDDEPSGGLSAGLPTALAFLSVFLDRPVPQDVASSGVLVTDSHDVLVLRRVGEPEYKVRGACNRTLALLILPEGNRRDLEQSPLVPAVVGAEVVRYASDLDEAVALTWGEDIWIE
jgi:tetratricopeptide (TPR) repeat protein